jgi:pimeloyl-ACP methyl ester carboxylesterase
MYFLLGVVAAGTHAQTPEIASQLINTTLQEDGKAIRLEILVRKPPGPGPFPTVVFNHGSTGRGDNPELFRRSWTSSTVASFFVDRGWMIIFPQRRGRGSSEGRYDEGFEADRSRYSCQPQLSLPGVDRAIEDIDAVMAHVRTRSDVLQSKLLLAGQSRGGILSIAYAGERPDVFVGVVNFVGGWMSDRCPNPVAINTTTFKRGAKFQRPTLWLYGDADPFYSLSHSRANFEAFTAAGGKGHFESYLVPGQNAGHGVIAHPKLWTEHLTQYLESIK